MAEDVSLRELQRRVYAFEQDKQLTDETALEKCLLLGEEVGELFKAVRQATGMGSDEGSLRRDLGHEVIDVLFYLLAIANRFDLELQEAFFDKLAHNQTREWRKGER